MSRLDDLRSDRGKIRCADSDKECGEACDERFIIGSFAAISNRKQVLAHAAHFMLEGLTPE